MQSAVRSKDGKVEVCVVSPEADRRLDGLTAAFVELEERIDELGGESRHVSPAARSPSSCCTLA